MKALVWHGKEDIRCDTVPDAHIEQPTDAVIKVTSCAICGSDLHLFNNYMPGMKKGDVLGHETMGKFRFETVRRADEVLVEAAKVDRSSSID